MELALTTEHLCKIWNLSFFVLIELGMCFSLYSHCYMSV